MTGSPVRVFVTNNFPGDGVTITLMLRYDTAEAVIVRFADDGHAEMRAMDRAVAADPSMILPHDFARALLDALLRHYEGASDMHTVRSDLLHERDRVDKLTDALIRLAVYG